MMYAVRFIYAVLLSFGVCLSARAQELRSHDATYVMKQIINYTQNWSPVERADGMLRYKFRQTCDGWTVEHHTVMNMDYGNDEQVQMIWSYTSWEAKDGSKLRFRSRTKHNGVDAEEYVGEAVHEKDATIVTYSKPVGKKETLPKATYFPTAHLIKSIELAQKGENLFNASYFDGSGQDLNFEVNTFMTAFKGKKLTAVKDVSLSNIATWDMNLAFFQPGSQESTPQMEMGARYRQDGVSTRLLQDFSDFVLEGQLVDFSYADEPVCKK